MKEQNILSDFVSIFVCFFSFKMQNTFTRTLSEVDIHCYTLKKNNNLQFNTNCNMVYFNLILSMKDKILFS